MHEPIVYSLGAVLAELARRVDDHRLRAALAVPRRPTPSQRFAVRRSLLRRARRDRGRHRPGARRREPSERHRPRSGPHRADRAVATRPLASAPSSRAGRRNGAVLRAALHRPSSPPEGIAVSRRRRRRHRRPRLGRTIVVIALVGVALGSALVLGQAFVTMSAPQAAGTVAGPDPVPAPDRTGRRRIVRRPLLDRRRPRMDGLRTGEGIRDLAAGRHRRPDARRSGARCPHRGVPRCRPRRRRLVPVPHPRVRRPPGE